jgi:hypothetical protein
VFERFTERARQVVVLAQEEARTLKHNYIGTEHLLLGLLREEKGVAARVLESLDIRIEPVRAQVVAIVGSAEEVTVGQIPFTPRAKKVLEISLREALGLGHNYIGTEHILLALARENDGVGARILLDYDAGPEKVRNTVLRLLGEAGERGHEAASTPAPAPVVEASIQIGFGEPVRDLLVAAAARALADRRTEVELADLLLAIVEDQSGSSALAKLLIDRSSECDTPRGSEQDKPDES